jgi:acetolactate synthase-1/2/3 large subunit
MSEARLPSGGEILVEALRTQGVDHAFCVPGESYLAVLDALHDAPDIALTVCRQEGGAAMMAEAYGKLTGRPGICFVTRGPGATNASAGVHIAYQDSTPMILFIGQVGRDQRDREAFQEIDYRRMFGQMAKWVTEIDDPARLPEYLARAFQTATGGRPGPVVLALPEDMLRLRAVAPAAERYTPVQAHPGAGELERLAQLLGAAERPLVLLGGGGWDAEACARIQGFAEAWRLPVAVSFRCQDYFDNLHPNYAGELGIVANPKLLARLQACDLLLVLGARLGEITTGGYTRLTVPRPAQRLIHVHPGPEELGRVYQPSLAINAGMRAMAAGLAGLAPSMPPAWGDQTAAARRDYESWSTPGGNPGAVQLGEIMAWLDRRLPAEAIFSNGAGNYSQWLQRFHRYRGYRSQLAPTSGSMGYGLPAAIAAKRLHPDRPAIAFAGDGCFQMTGQELGTAVQYGAAVIVIIINNGMYGTIRMHQEINYPGRISGTDLVNPDFARLAEAYGVHGERVEATADFAPAFERALAAGGPSLIEIRLDPEAITTGQTLSEIRGTSTG